MDHVLCCISFDHYGWPNGVICHLSRSSTSVACPSACMLHVDVGRTFSWTIDSQLGSSCQSIAWINDFVTVFLSALRMIIADSSLWWHESLFVKDNVYHHIIVTTCHNNRKLGSILLELFATIKSEYQQTLDNESTSAARPSERSSRPSTRWTAVWKSWPSRHLWMGNPHDSTNSKAQKPLFRKIIWIIE